jgi:hypothetical protein
VRVAFTGGAFFLSRKAAGEGAHGIGASGVDQVLGEPALVFGDRRIPLQPLGVDDGVVEARLRAVIEEDGVQHLASGRGEPEGDVRDAEDGLALREARLDGADALDGFLRRADVVRVARADGKHERIEDEVARRDPVLLGEEGVRALRDGQLALARDRHALLLVLVDAAHHHRTAVGAQERHDLLEALLAVLQVDRVDDGLALAVPQRQLDDGGVGGVDHERHLHLAGDLRHEAIHVGQLVAIGVGQADVEHLGRALDLGASDLGRVLEAVVDDQVLELA